MTKPKKASKKAPKKVLLKLGRRTNQPNEAKKLKKAPQAKPAKRPSKKLPPELYWLAKWNDAATRLKKAKSEYKSAYAGRPGTQPSMLDYIIRRADTRKELRIATEAEPKFMRLFAECAAECARERAKLKNTAR